MDRRILRRAAPLATLVLVASCGGGFGGGGSTLLLCDPPPAFPAGVVHGPQVALPTPTSVTIAWETSAAVIGSVDYGTTTGYGTTVTEAVAATDHAITVPGLAAATAYHYRIDDAGVPAGGDRTFRTPPSSAAASVRFVVLGDTGSGCQEEFDAVARVEALAPEFVLNTGDVAYFAGTASEVMSRFLIPFAPLFEAVPVFPCLGNHDVVTADGQPYLDALVLPTNLADGTERYYSFDWGPCHVVALDSNEDTSVGSLERAWLDTDLATSAATWKIVFFHHPPYSSSAHGSDLALRANLGPVLDARHVDVVFNGHDHDYERTYPMLAEAVTDLQGDPDYVSPAGTVYVVTGGGGQSLYPSLARDFTAASKSVHHVVQVDVAGNVLTLSARRFDGSEFDRMTITK